MYDIALIFKTLSWYPVGQLLTLELTVIPSFYVSFEENEFLSVCLLKMEMKVWPQDFVWAIGVPKKNANFQKKNKKHHSGELHKKDTILHQAQQITLFTHPVYMFRTWRNTVREFMGIFISLSIQRRELNLSPGVKLISRS